MLPHGRTATAAPGGRGEFMKRLPCGAEWLLLGGVAVALAGWAVRLIVGVDPATGFGLGDLVLSISSLGLAGGALTLRRRAEDAVAAEAANRRLLETACDGV